MESKSILNILSQFCLRYCLPVFLSCQILSRVHESRPVSMSFHLTNSLEIHACLVSRISIKCFNWSPLDMSWRHQESLEIKTVREYLMQHWRMKFHDQFLWWPYLLLFLFFTRHLLLCVLFSSSKWLKLSNIPFFTIKRELEWNEE